MYLALTAYKIQEIPAKNILQFLNEPVHVLMY